MNKLGLNVSRFETHKEQQVYYNEFPFEYKQDTSKKFDIYTGLNLKRNIQYAA